jgi:hypothetical protein
MRALSLVVVTASLLVAGCDAGCEEGLVEQADGTCVEPIDSDTTPTDDTDEPSVPAIALLTLEWTIDQLPNDNAVELLCDGREIHSQDGFTARKTYSIEKEVANGVVCEVKLSDARGGRLPAGRLLNCSKVVAEWDSERGYTSTAASVEMYGCREGCADPVALNYDPQANLDDGSCEYIDGCTDPRARNYDPLATRNDGSCDFGGFGMIELTVITDNYPNDTTATVTCDGFAVISRADFSVPNSSYYMTALVDSGFDCQVLIGDDVGDQGAGGMVEVCGQQMAEWARVTGASGSGGSLGPYQEQVAEFFMAACSGCTDPLSPSYDPAAYVEDGSCSLP